MWLHLCPLSTVGLSCGGFVCVCFVLRQRSLRSIDGMPTVQNHAQFTAVRDFFSANYCSAFWTDKKWIYVMMSVRLSVWPSMSKGLLLAFSQFLVTLTNCEGHRSLKKKECIIFSSFKYVSTWAFVLVYIFLPLQHVLFYSLIKM